MFWFVVIRNPDRSRAWKEYLPIALKGSSTWRADAIEMKKGVEKKMKPHKRIMLFLGLVIVCICTLPVSAYTFSMTNIEHYDGAWTDLYPYGTNSHVELYNSLTGQGWTQSFYDTNANVDDTDFATAGGGLNNVDLHYHFGHGTYQSPTQTGKIVYKDYPASSLERPEVYKKWGTGWISPNKWVVLDVCWALQDLQWGAALRNSHGILGIADTKQVRSGLTQQFLNNCITNDYPITTAWKSATQRILQGDGTTVRVIFDTEDQLLNDHLPGHGTVAASETYDDDTVYYDQWYT